jgi:putative ABC transport system permease protein
MARVIPPIFLLVSAFLINMILSRLIALEREQIGLLMALGYSGFTIAMHYIKLVVIIAAAGVLIGFVAGTWLGDGLTRLYAQFFHFPFFIFERSAGVYAIAAIASVAAAVAGALKAVYSAASLPPATAMQPAPPTLYRKAGVFTRFAGRVTSQLAVMAVRHLVRWPVQKRPCHHWQLDGGGAAGHGHVLVRRCQLHDRYGVLQDRASGRHNLVFDATRPQGPCTTWQTCPVCWSLNHSAPWRLKSVLGPKRERIAMTAKPERSELSRVLDLDLDPLTLPEAGIVLSERLAWKLGARTGDLVQLSLLEEGERQVDVPVTLINQTYTGLSAHMQLKQLMNCQCLARAGLVPTCGLIRCGWTKFTRP